MSVVLRTTQFLARFLVLGGAYRNPVGNCVAADDCSAGMNAGVTDIVLEHLGILYRVAQIVVGRCLSLLKFGNALYCVRQIHLQTVGQLIGNKFAKFVRYLERKFLNSRNILYR